MKDYNTIAFDLHIFTEDLTLTKDVIATAVMTVLYELEPSSYVVLSPINIPKKEEKDLEI